MKRTWHAAIFAAGAIAALAACGILTGLDDLTPNDCAGGLCDGGQDSALDTAQDRTLPGLDAQGRDAGGDAATIDPGDATDEESDASLAKDATRERDASDASLPSDASDASDATGENDVSDAGTAETGSATDASQGDANTDSTAYSSDFAAGEDNRERGCIDRIAWRSMLSPMTTSWNFERRKVTCAKFLVGVSLLSKGKAGFVTTLEGVRSRVRLPPEDALFAARRLDEEGLITFDAGGAVTANAKGLDRAEEVLRSARSQAQASDDVTRTLRAGGIPLELLKLSVLANGGTLECGAPAAEAERPYRLSLSEDELTIERGNADGSYEPAPPFPAE